MQILRITSIPAWFLLTHQSVLYEEILSHKCVVSWVVQTAITLNSLVWARRQRLSSRRSTETGWRPLAAVQRVDLALERREDRNYSRPFENFNIERLLETNRSDLWLSPRRINLLCPAERCSLENAFETDRRTGWYCGNCGLVRGQHCHESKNPGSTRWERAETKTGFNPLHVCGFGCCGNYESRCAVCDGASHTANESRICRDCRRLIKTVERKVTRRKCQQRHAAKKQLTELLDYLRGKHEMKAISRLLSQRRRPSPGPSPSVAEGFARARTSPTS